MSFNKKQAKEIVAGIDRTHKQKGFNLAGYVKIEPVMAKTPTYFPQSFIDVKHENLQDVFDAFRRKFPHGQFLLIIVVENEPEHPPKNQPVLHRLAKIKGTYRPAKLEALKLDTNWLDKAFEYQKRATY